MKLRTLGVALSAIVMATVASVNASAGGGHKRHDGAHNIATFSLAYANAIGLNTAIETAFEGQNNATLLAAMPNHRSKRGAPEYIVVLSTQADNGSNTQTATRINALDGHVIESETLGFFSRMRHHMKVEDEAISKVKLTSENAIQIALKAARSTTSSESQAGASDTELLMIRMISPYNVPIYAVTLSQGAYSEKRPITIGVNAETGDASALPSYGKHGGKHCDDDEDEHESERST